jgi:hypothetical protein
MQPKAQWYCIGHNPTRWALVPELGLKTGTPVNDAQALAIIERQPTGRWVGHTQKPWAPVDEPSLTLAQDTAEQILTKDPIGTGKRKNIDFDKLRKAHRD